jgi:hypothetical protein
LSANEPLVAKRGICAGLEIGLLVFFSIVLVLYRMALIIHLAERWLHYRVRTY